MFLFPLFIFLLLINKKREKESYHYSSDFILCNDTKVFFGCLCDVKLHTRNYFLVWRSKGQQGIMGKQASWKVGGRSI